MNDERPPWVSTRDPWSIDYLPLHPWGNKSKEAISTVDPRLVYIANKLADIWNMTIIHGYRGRELQTQLHEQNPNGALPWPLSEHNHTPSRAIDIAPYPVNWEKVDRFDMMIGAAYAIAEGGNFRIDSGKFFSNVLDYPHIQVVD